LTQSKTSVSIKISKEFFLFNEKFQNKFYEFLSKEIFIGRELGFLT